MNESCQTHEQEFLELLWEKYCEHRTEDHLPGVKKCDDIIDHMKAIKRCDVFVSLCVSVSVSISVSLSVSTPVLLRDII